MWIYYFFKGRIDMRIFFFLLIIFLPSLCVCQKNDASIVLETSLDFIKPDKFYICKVIDSREDKSLNNFRINFSGSQKTDNDTLSFSNALMFLFNKCLSKDTTLVPVIIDIRQLSIVPKMLNLLFILSTRACISI